MRLGLPGLQAATETWRHKDGRVVVLAGAMHLADESFWAKTRDSINGAAAEGSMIHLERIEKIPEGHELTERQARIVELMKRFQGSMMRLVSLTGLKYQSQTLTKEYDTYGSHDVSFLEMSESIDLEKMEKSMEVGDPFEELTVSQQQRLGRLMLNVFRFTPLVRKLVTSFGEKTNFMDDDYILKYRNSYAMDHVLQSDNKTHYVFWGAAHLEGMGAILAGEGFKRNLFRKWTTVIPWSAKAPTRAGQEAKHVVQ